LDGVFIIDPVWAGIKMAEVLVNLRRSYGIEVCRSSGYGICADWDRDIPLSLV
jgi:hypothetical protein